MPFIIEIASTEPLIISIFVKSDVLLRTLFAQIKESFIMRLLPYISGLCLPTLLMANIAFASKDCYVAYKVLNTGTYKGGCVNGRAHGYGVAMNHNKRIQYHGQFVNGQLSGNGKRIMGKMISSGQWKNGKLHGKGNVIFEDGGSYVGGFHMDNEHGIGIHKHNDGRVYSGQWHMGKAHGQGKMTFPSGAYYQGQWVNGKIYGHGTESNQYGAVYKGQFHNGSWHGKGQLQFTDGTTATGVWSNGNIVGGDALRHMQKINSQAPTLRVPAPIAYSGGCDSGHWVQSKTHDGSIVTLENGSVWQVGMIDRIKTILWLTTTSVTVCNGKLINTDDNEVVNAVRLR